MPRRPKIARDDKKPLTAFGFQLDESGKPIRDYTRPIYPGKDYGCDPLGDGKYRMVPSGDIVDFEERCRRLPRQNPPPLDFPPELILDPFLPVPAKFGRKKTKHLAELREAYQYSMKKRFDRKKVGMPEDVAALLAPLMSALTYEQMVVLPMDSHARVIGEPLITSKGGVDGTDSDVRVILRSVLLAGGVSFIVAHNHPSGEIEASAADRSCTTKLSSAARILDIPLQDHIIIGKEGTFSSLRRDHPDCWR